MLMPASLAASRMALWGPLRDRPELWSQPRNQARIRQALALWQELAEEGELDPAVRAWGKDLRRAAGRP